MLVPPGDPPTLAAALAALIREPTRRDALGAAGEERVRREFDMRSGVGTIAGLFGLSSGTDRVRVSGFLPHGFPLSGNAGEGAERREAGEGAGRLKDPHPTAAIAAATHSRPAGEG